VPQVRFERRPNPRSNTCRQPLEVFDSFGS
jgi:hypothetical protein